jgi:hypothetical protein
MLLDVPKSAIGGRSLFSKHLTKEELSKQLAEKCEQALLLDNSIHTIYASQPLPSKGKLRTRKRKPDAFDLELERLKMGQTTTSQLTSSLAPATPEPTLEYALEQEVSEFLRCRRRK